jgi:hypothetical protein
MEKLEIAFQVNFHPYLHEMYANANANVNVIL